MLEAMVEIFRFAQDAGWLKMHIFPFYALPRYNQTILSEIQ
jgi:hypothetical protein